MSITLNKAAITVNINERALIIKSWYDTTASSDIRGTQRKSKYKTSHAVSSRGPLNSKRISVYLGIRYLLEVDMYDTSRIVPWPKEHKKLFYYHSVPILDFGY